MRQFWKSALRRYARDESGVATIFAVFMILMMILVGGIGVDLMSHEMERTRLQQTLDRAVLAAADLDQTLDPQEVVEDYFEKAGMANYLASVDVDEGLNYRIVSAEANVEVPTAFMRLMGVDVLTAPARGTAEERISNVEISMILDISGSMGRNGKMDNLHDAGKAFVDSVIREETEDLISISLIPYTAQVNAGELIFDELNVNELHGFSHCIDFDPSDFIATNLSFSKWYDHMQHFEWSSSTYSPIRNPGCPDEDFEEIVPFTQNKMLLKNTIDEYRARANTAIHLGMKWGVAMLDPSFRPITQEMTLNGNVEGVFGGRPVAYDDEETLKTIVLMTDGQNVDTYRIADWAYNHPNEYAHWNRWTLWNYLYRHVPSWQRNQFYYRKYSAGQADAMLDDICDAAKDQGIVVWTVGFEVNDHGANVMESCASSPSHFFRVEGVEITEAFEAIASQINQLRLTQ